VRRLIVAAVLSCALVSCGGSQPDAAVCPEPKAGGDASIQPDGIDLRDYGTLTETRKKGDFISAVVISERSVDELYDPLLKEVSDADYNVLNSENEHFEAEIFFGDPSGRVALLNLREGPCLGQVTIRLTFG
jgi:hypothetical protein